MLRELEQYQNEKRKALMNHESAKMKAIEERYAHELKEWRATLADRKAVSTHTQAHTDRERHTHTHTRRHTQPYAGTRRHMHHSIS